MTPAFAVDEWHDHWMLPVAAAFGYATSVIHIYSLGPYVAPLTESFGWSRTQITMGLTVCTLVQALVGVPFGLAVDRWGARRFGLGGALLTCGGFALLAVTDGDPRTWFLLWLVLSVAAVPIQATVWTSAVASRFSASRGLALAVTLCGASFAITVFPIAATWLIGRVGWRAALPIQGGLWAIVVLPLLYLFFRGAHDAPRGVRRAAPSALPGVALREGLRSSVYLRLLLASALFTFTILALVVHFVPILTDAGVDPLKAAAVAGLIGVASIVGRLGTGLLLDRLPGSLVGAGVFLLPALGSLFLAADGGAGAAQVAAALLVGLALGAEIDVIVYLTTRHFGLRSFGGLYGGLLTALSVGTALGPLAASAVFDRTGGYGPFLLLGAALMVASSLILASLPRPSAAPRHGVAP